MSDTAKQHAETLIGEHGLEGADKAAFAELLKAQQAGDNYRLSIWREVRQILAKKRETGKVQK